MSDLPPYPIFKQNADSLMSRINEVCSRVGRDRSNIRILPVTKTFPIEAVQFALDFGFNAVGENRVQEVASKQGGYRGKIIWELIGHLQGNKVNLALEHFDKIQSVDSIKLINRLGRAVEERGMQLPIQLQFNTGDDPAKYGFSTNDMKPALDAVLQFPGLQLEGLMTIAPLTEDKSIVRDTFARLNTLKKQIEGEYKLSLAELSMGMSGDLEMAIEEGSTCIRVGTALFGKRS